MILTGKEIKKAVDNGDIIINEFNEKQLQPNSYDITLNPKMKKYDFSKTHYLSVDCEYPMVEKEIPKEGMILHANTLYLAATNETVISKKYVPVLVGRSSIARLGITIESAGLGDLGWGFVDDKITNPTWTLELWALHPVKILPNIRIGQIIFFESKGEAEFYKGKYHYQREAQESLSYMDF